MPLSTGQDPKPTSIIGALAQKQAQKSSLSTATIPSKKERRNAAARDTNGGAAAVMNISSKVFEGNKTATPPPPSVSPTPDVKPPLTASTATKITSPLLGSLSANGFARSTGQNTTEWARNIPPFSGSPGNLINLSDSPPTVPSSYDDKSVVGGWNQRERMVDHEHVPSASPPPGYRRRPLSMQIDGHHAYEDTMSQKAPSIYRRNSGYSQYTQRYGPHPPLPHQPQPHFYGAPDINLGLPMRPVGLKPGSHGYYCGFDSINISRTGSKQTESVVVSGYEGGLDILSVSKSGNNEISTLDGLRGGVYNAKILPWTVEGGLAGGFPLIAVVIHGPVLNEVNTPGTEDLSPEFVGTDAAGKSKNGSVSSSGRDQRNQGSDLITHYQTTVEVYSLSTKGHVATLLSLPKTQLSTPFTPSTPATSPHFIRPPPAGALTISADAGNIVVTSGITGELWIFRQIRIDDDTSMSFRCLGKFWTTVQQPSICEPSVRSEFPDSDIPYNDARGNRPRSKAEAALVSLRGRWLAYCPSASIHQVSLRAFVDVSKGAGRVPGINSYAPPQLPSANCSIDTPQGEEFWGRLSRQAAQEAIKRAKWIGDQGSKVWSSYWNKPSSNVTGNWQPHPAEPLHDFPPTHGAALQYDTSQSEPVLISIIDLDKLANLRSGMNVASAMLATFKMPFGCSYMSFSPSGLALFTASSKGDVQFIWDLMRIQHTKSSALQPQVAGHSQGIHIRQIACFTRLTVARIVDVVWTLPHGETIAMVTERNTVHFLDIPQNAFAWPPPRPRSKASSSLDPSANRKISPSAISIASNAVNAAWNFTQPFLARPRGLSGPGPVPSRTGTIAASLTAIAGQGGKALASGISKSFGAASGTIQHFRRAGDNKLHLPQTATICSIGCVKWLGGHNKEIFAALLDGYVKLYTVKHVRSKSKPDVFRIHIGTTPIDIKLPSVPDYTVAPMARRAFGLDDELDVVQREVKENYSFLRRVASVVKTGALLGTESSIPQAEIESNAPYQPFHTDPRVGLFVYAAVAPHLSSPSVSALFSPQFTGEQTVEQSPAPVDEPWVFGRPIKAVKLSIGNTQLDEDDLTSSEYHRALPARAIERVTTKIPDDVAEPIVSTTRRRKAGPRRGGDVADDEEGFFEDDCDVIDFASNRV